MTTRQARWLVRWLQTDQAPVRLDRLLAQPLLLRVDGGGEDVGLAGGAVAAALVVLLRGRGGVDGWMGGGGE